MQQQENCCSFNDITALARIVRWPTFIDFALTKWHMGRLDSVKGAKNGDDA